MLILMPIFWPFILIAEVSQTTVNLYKLCTFHSGLSLNRDAVKISVMSFELRVPVTTPKYTIWNLKLIQID